MADLYETRHGLFGGGIRTLWEGGAPPEGQGAQGGTQGQPQGSAPDALGQALAGLLNRHGSSDAVALHLLNENRQLREERRTLRGQVPAEGSVVLTPEQVQQWQAYQQLGTDPAALRTRLEQGDQAQEREQGRELASASGANAEVLSDFLRLTGLRAETRDVPAQGDQPARRAVHLLNAEGQDQGELRAYVQQHRAAYLPSLFPQASQSQGGGTVITGQAGAGSTGGTPSSNPMAEALNATRPAPAEGQQVRRAFDFTPRS